VEAGRYEPRTRETSFDLKDFSRDISGYNRKLEEVLHGR
jgi:urea carboxylase